VLKVATKQLATALNDFYEVNGTRYTLVGLTPPQFSAVKIVAETPLVTAAEIAAGTDTAAKTISAKDLKAAIDAKEFPDWLPDAATIAVRDALTNVITGNRIRVLDAGDTRWAAFEARGKSPNPNWFKLSDEDNLNSPLPSLTVANAKAGTATEPSLITAKTLKDFANSAALWPTIQASLDKDVVIAAGTAPSVIHLNDANKPNGSPWSTSWNVLNAADGEHHAVINLGQPKVITISNADGVIVNGRQVGGFPANVTIPANSSATITHTLNTGMRWVNVLLLSSSVYYVAPSESFDLLNANGIGERLGVFGNVNLQNGPNNAAQGVSGTWSYGGDPGSGVLTLNISKASDLGLAGGIWTNTSSTRLVNGLSIQEWGGWKRFDLSNTWAESTLNQTALTGASLTLLDGHTVAPAYLAASPLKLRPKTNWGNVPTPTSGATVNGLWPEWGNDEVSLTWVPATATYNLSYALKNTAQTVRYTANAKIPDRTNAVLGDGATAMTLTTAAAGKIVKVCWVGTSTTALPAITLGTGLKFYASWITTPDGTLSFAVADKNKWITLIGRSDGWDVVLGA
jgi:hypothetical protein